MSPVKQGETSLNTAPPHVEQAPNRAPEKHQSTETKETKTQPGGGPAPQQTQTPAPTLPPIVPPIPQDDTSQQPATLGSNPVAAADDDLIEKEWVDRAKKIVSETKNDPYLQEQEVSKLQADYLKKRWSKEINVPGD
jgi:hypothetical protein